MENRNFNFLPILLVLFSVQLIGIFTHAAENQPYKLYIGWAKNSITPDRPVALDGQFNARIARSVRDSVTCTVLAIETRDINNSVETAIMVSCDLIAIRGTLREEVVNILRSRMPGFDTDKLIMNATHTHTGPVLTEGKYDIPIGVMNPTDYVNFAAGRIADAVIKAWSSRKPAGMSWGLGQAVVGYNRRTVYFEPVSGSFGTGTAVMYGSTNREDFSHIEGYEDHGLEMMFFWDEKKKLTGMVLNVACPAQETEHLSEVSADFWHEARVELHKRYGDDVFILPQCASAGDQSPHLLWRKKAEEEMLNLRGINRRQEIGRRIANAVDDVFPYVQGNIKNAVVFSHLIEEVSLPRRMVTKEEAEEAEMLAKQQPDRAAFHRSVVTRYKNQNADPWYPVKINVIRLGDVAVATNPFELFIDFGLRIKTRSDAVLTFIVQLSNGSSSYLPTLRASEGGGYSAIPQSNQVGFEGGQVLVEKTLDLIAKSATVIEQEEMDKKPDAVFYPNPTDDIISIRLNNNSYRTVEVTVYNMEGKNIMHKLFYDPYSISFSMKGYNSGTYIVKLKVSGQEFVKKFIFERQ